MDITKATTIPCPSDNANPLAVYEKGCITFGGHPHPKYSLSTILGHIGEGVIVDLMEEDELQKRGDYRSLLPESVKHLHFPIPDRTVPSVEYVNAILDVLRPFLGRNIYIHCLGGNGRSALIAACLVGKNSEYNFDTIYQHLLTQHCRRVYHKYAPLSDAGQLEFIKNYLS
jgi:hypothetical protein